MKIKQIVEFKLKGEVLISVYNSPYNNSRLLIVSDQDNVLSGDLSDHGYETIFKLFTKQEFKKIWKNYKKDAKLELIKHITTNDQKVDSDLSQLVKEANFYLKVKKQ